MPLSSVRCAAASTFLAKCLSFFRGPAPPRSELMARLSFMANAVICLVVWLALGASVLGVSVLGAPAAPFPGRTTPSSDTSQHLFRRISTSNLERTNATDPATGAPICLNKLVSLGGGGGREITATCPGPCLAPPWDGRATFPWDCDSASPRVRYPTSEAPTAAMQGNLTFYYVEGQQPVGGVSCFYQYEFTDSRSPYYHERSGSMCPLCPVAALSADPRWVWNDPDHKSGSLLGPDVTEADTLSCYYPDFGQTTDCGGNGRVAPYGIWVDKGEWRYRDSLPSIDTQGETWWTAIKSTATSNRACISTDSTSCLWNKVKACTESLKLTADHTTPFLECGARHMELFGSTGYDTEGHWCNRTAGYSY